MKHRLSACFPVLLGLFVTACGQSPLEETLAGLGGENALQDMSTLSIEATGTRWEIDEVYSPGPADEGRVPFTMQLRYDLAGDKLRLDYTHERPAVGEQQTSQIIAGELGAIEGQDARFDPPTTTAMTSDRWAAARREQRLLNPHLILRQALADPSAITELTLHPTLNGTQLLDGIEHHVLVIDEEVAPIRLYVSVSTGQIAKAETVENDPLRRDVAIEVVYEDWAPAEGGLSFPNRVLLTLDGERAYEEVRSSIEVNHALDPALFEFAMDSSPEFDPELAAWGAANRHMYRMMAARGFPRAGQHTSIEVEEIAPRVHHVRGASHHSLVIEQEAGIVVAEAPLHELRSEAVIDWIKATFPDKPMTHVIATHHHQDHSAGIRTYIAEGVAVVVHEAASEFYEDVFQASSTLLPDRLALSPATAEIETVPANGSFTIPDAALPVEVYPLENDHAEDMVIIYVRNAGVVFNSDIYNPDPAATDVGAGGQVVNDGIVSNDLDVSIIAGGHGTVIAYGDFQSLLGGRSTTQGPPSTSVAN